MPTGFFPTSRQDKSYDENSSTQFGQGLHLLELFDAKSHSRVLDIGCGNGKTTIALFACNPGMHVDAIDVDGNQIEMAQKHWEDYLSQTDSVAGAIDFHVANAMDIDADGIYDLVFSNAALHWLPPDEIYGIIFKALCSKGEIAVHQGAEGTYKELHDAAHLALSNLGLSGAYANWKFPAFYCSLECIANTLDKIGFENVEIECIETDESENLSLITDFAVASLPYYKLPEMSDAEFEAIEEEYLRICHNGIHPTARRLYITARKP